MNRKRLAYRIIKELVPYNECIYHEICDELFSDDDQDRAIGEQITMHRLETSYYNQEQLYDDFISMMWNRHYHLMRYIMYNLEKEE